jgi:adenylosuccinate lyase
MRAWETGEEFQALLLADPDLRAILAPAEIESCFDLGYHLRHVNAIFRRVGLA